MQRLVSATAGGAVEETAHAVVDSSRSAGATTQTTPVAQLTENGTGSPANETTAAINGTRQFLEQFVTTESRIAVSIAIIAIAVVAAWLLLPRAVHEIDRLIVDRLFTGRYADTADLISHYIPTTFSGIVLRTIQLAVFVGTITSVLVIWGYAGIVADSAVYVLDQVPILTRVALSVVLFISAYVGARILADSVSNLSDQTEWMTEHQEEIVLRISQLGLFTLAAMVFLGLWRVDLGGLLVGAGFLGIVIGFAARQTLGSLIAGFVLMFSRPFTIGDWVQIGDQEGIVTDITIFNTRLENFDGEFVIIPNDRVSDRAITNRSEKGLLRLRVDVGIDYDADPERAKEVAVETIRELDAIVTAPPPQVFPKSFGDSAVVLELRFWIDHPTPPRKWRAISAVIQAIKDAFEAEGIKIPYPQRELSGRAETGGFQVHEQPGAETDGQSAQADRPEQE